MCRVLSYSSSSCWCSSTRIEHGKVATMGCTECATVWGGRDISSIMIVSAAAGSSRTSIRIHVAGIVVIGMAGRVTTTQPTARVWVVAA